MGAWEGAHPGCVCGGGGEGVTDRLSGGLTFGWELSSWADQTAAQIPGGTGPGDGCSETSLSASALSPLPTPNFHPAFLSSPWSVASGAGVEEPADSLGGVAGRLKPSVHESVRLWRSCQLETTQQHSESVPQGHCYGRKEAPRTRQTWPQILAPPLISSGTLGKLFNFFQSQCLPL